MAISKKACAFTKFFNRLADVDISVTSTRGHDMKGQENVSRNGQSLG